MLWQSTWLIKSKMEVISIATYYYDIGDFCTNDPEKILFLLGACKFLERYRKDKTHYICTIAKKEKICPWTICNHVIWLPGLTFALII